MPTYDYACNSCDHRFETFQSITERPLRKCPRCGKRSLKRLIGAGAGIIFRGSGFYETDYRRKKSEPEKAPKGKDSSEKKSEPKDKNAAD